MTDIERAQEALDAAVADMARVHGWGTGDGQLPLSHQYVVVVQQTGISSDGGTFSNVPMFFGPGGNMSSILARGLLGTAHDMVSREILRGMAPDM